MALDLKRSGLMFSVSLAYKVEFLGEKDSGTSFLHLEQGEISVVRLHWSTMTFPSSKGLNWGNKKMKLIWAFVMEISIE